jgi:hypothetical protein
MVTNFKKKLYRFFTVILVFTSTIHPIVPANAAVTCYKVTEYTSGFNKICIYNCLGSEAAITIGATQLCPLTINR